MKRWLCINSMLWITTMMTSVLSSDIEFHVEPKTMAQNSESKTNVNVPQFLCNFWYSLIGISRRAFEMRWVNNRLWTVMKYDTRSTSKISTFLCFASSFLYMHESWPTCVSLQCSVISITMSATMPLIHSETTSIFMALSCLLFTRGKCRWCCHVSTNFSDFYFNQFSPKSNKILTSFLSFSIVPLEMETLRREHFNRWYNLIPYYFSVILFEIPFQVSFFCRVTLSRPWETNKK